jgi:transketolase
MNNSIEDIQKIANIIKLKILESTAEADSGHPTSSFSAVEIMTALFFCGFFKYDLKNPQHPNNDRLIFSKGHAAPLFYSLWAATGAIDYSELLTLRKFGSRLEGHPTQKFPYTEAATGSLGQGLSIGLGMALAGKYLSNLNYKTYVLVGDGELLEGSNWEAAAIASHYNLNNLVAFIDVNRLEQSGETIHQWDLESYKKKFEAFGWETLIIEDGNDIILVADELKILSEDLKKPLAIIAKTKKGKGLSGIENELNWHSKPIPLTAIDSFRSSLNPDDFNLTLKLEEPQSLMESGALVDSTHSNLISYKIGDLVSTRKAYGESVSDLAQHNKKIVGMDAGVENSTFADVFLKELPEQFFKMYIAEQNMVGAALGLSLRGFIPFISSFAAFLSRAHDQIRMSQYSNSNIKFVGAYAGVSIRKDGSSQMGLEDIAMFRSMLNSVILYPSDAVSTNALVKAAAKHFGNVYLRITRDDLPVIYNNTDEFKIGGSNILKASENDRCAVIAAGITVHESLKAYEILKSEGINIRVVDLYSIKPLDTEVINLLCDKFKNIIVVEDHFAEGGIGEAVASEILKAAKSVNLHHLAVRKMPSSGESEEMRIYEEISAAAIVKKVKRL